MQWLRGGWLLVLAVTVPQVSAAETAAELRERYRTHSTAPAPQAAQPANDPAGPGQASSTQFDVITTKDGKVHTGQILRELERGFLFRETTGDTSLIEFAAVSQIQKTGAPVPPESGAAVAPSAPPPPPGVQAHVGPQADSNAAKRAFLEQRLHALRDERHGMASGYVAAVLGGAGLVVFLVLSIPIGIVLMAVAVPFAIYYAVVASSLDRQIHDTEVDLSRADQQSGQASVPVPTS